jgi:hypothetical protein
MNNFTISPKLVIEIASRKKPFQCTLQSKKFKQKQNSFHAKNFKNAKTTLQSSKTKIREKTLQASLKKGFKFVR